MLAVLGALVANGLITILKFIGAILTGSSGMMAESPHSPFGYGKEGFFWSFIAAVFIFGVNATYAIYEGIEKVRGPHRSVAAITKAVKSHPNVVDVVEFLTVHLAPKQILVNAHINLRTT